MPKLRAVTFDLWQTLMHDSREAGRSRTALRMAAVQAALESEGIHTDLDRLRQAGRSCYLACDAIRDREEDIAFNDQVDCFLDFVEAGLSKRLPTGTLNVVRDAYGSMPPPNVPIIAPGALDVVRTLKSDGYALALISNTGATPGSTLRNLLAESGILKYLDPLIFSDEVGLSKPSRRIFQLTLDRLGLQPPEAVHVGDHPKMDILGAKRAGLRTVQVFWTDTYEKVDVEPDANIQVLADLPQALATLQRHP
ncbi:MAG: HAD family hydrolase [Dehalococcoidia bacterium]|nr:HAD family hydrolase [Dehalococcoidia bacterium]